jgi:hypothetical protein
MIVVLAESASILMSDIMQVYTANSPDSSNELGLLITKLMVGKLFY